MEKPTSNRRMTGVKSGHLSRVRTEGWEQKSQRRGVCLTIRTDNVLLNQIRQTRKGVRNHFVARGGLTPLQEPPDSLNQVIEFLFDG